MVIHGGSKQGKTWLRRHALGDDDVVVVVCLPSSSVTQLLEQALGMLGAKATLRMTTGSTFSGEIDLSMAAELGVKVLAKAKAKAGMKGGAERSGETETVPVGRTPGDLPWVALVLAEASRKVVFENFHYLPLETQKEFSYVLRGLLDYGVTTVLMGVWAQSDLLTFHNGDLEGRVEELRLEWSPAELDEALVRGCKALNVEFSPEIRATIVADCYGNIGLLHRLSAEVCKSGSVEKTVRGRKLLLDDFGAYEVARAKVARTLAGRYGHLTQSLADEAPVYEGALRAVVAATDVEHEAGLRISQLPSLIESAGGQRHTKPYIRRKMAEISDAQRKYGVDPPVFAWDAGTSRLFVVEQSFLFFRRFGDPEWPWED